MVSNQARTAQQGRAFYSSLTQWLDLLTPRSHAAQRQQQESSCHVPQTSEERQNASHLDTPLEVSQVIRAAKQHGSAENEETVLYLGYGSNMSVETFRGKRKIQPLSQINVLAPDLQLSFDLPGIAYTEPCFANVRYRHQPPPNPPPRPTEGSQPPYHKDRWSKGLVGVVYEVTKSDFVHIIATEGGGATYKDVLIDCYALPTDPMELVPITPSGTPFKAHTLFSPDRVHRPIPSYAQPSPRYLKLMTDGAQELGLPFEYQAYLHQIRTYKMTTYRQRLGQFVFLAIWSPMFAFLFGSARLFMDENGQYPPWLAKLAAAMFQACWGSYDDFFHDIFGDGERTMEPGGDDVEDFEIDSQDEKAGLMRSYEGRIVHAPADDNGLPSRVAAHTQSPLYS